MNVSRFSDAARFLERTESWLLEREAEHNLLLGITHQLRSGNHRFEQPIYLAAVEDAGAVVGCAFRTPPYKFGITSLPVAAISLLVEDAARVYDKLPAVLGPEEQALEFGRQWTEQHRGTATVGMRQRIHVVTTVEPPRNPAPGHLRRAVDADVPFVTPWLTGFLHETGLREADHEARARRVIGDGVLYLWEDGEPRSMVAAVGPTPKGIRIGYVYTPPPFRGHGYASVTVAYLTQRLLDDGRRFCFLYTDLANPTSNAIYRRLGYTPVSDVVDVVFAER